MKEVRLFITAEEHRRLESARRRLSYARNTPLSLPQTIMDAVRARYKEWPESVPPELERRPRPAALSLDSSDESLPDKSVSAV